MIILKDMKFSVNSRHHNSDQLLQINNSHQSSQFANNNHTRTSTINTPKAIEEVKFNGFLDLVKFFELLVWPIFIILLLTSLEVQLKGFGASAQSITPAERKYEEYYIEHEVSSSQAKNSVMTYDSDSLSPPPGCQKCTEEEMQYCGSSLMHDHCCCDKQYFERLPFIPHTCYLGTQPCTPIKNCATYARLRDCCCNKVLIKKWKAKNGAKLCEAISKLRLLIVILFVNFITIVF